MFRIRVQENCCQVDVFRIVRVVLISEVLRKRSHGRWLSSSGTMKSEYRGDFITQDGWKLIFDRLFGPITTDIRVTAVASG